MTPPRLAHLATDLLANERLPTRVPSPEAEARAVEAIAAALEMRTRRRRGIRIAGAVACAAIVVLGIGQLVSPRMATSPIRDSAPSPIQASAPPQGASVAHAAIVTATAVDPANGSVLARASGTMLLTANANIAVGDRVNASRSGNTGLALGDGSRLRIEPDAEVSILSLSSLRSFVLERGALRADVHKLGSGERFVVTTVDAEVEVHGTSFRVAVLPTQLPCAPTRTRVHVFEGVVAVRSLGRETRLFAGDDFPKDCVDGVPKDSATATSIATATIPAPSPPAAGVRTASSGSTSSSILAEQNKLLADATAARKRGDHATAVAAYERLLSKQPDAFLAETATVERMRALEPIDRGRAREAARAYLSRYPTGFARADAERLAQ